MAGETEVETPAQPEVTEEKKEIAEAENKTEEKKGRNFICLFCSRQLHYDIYLF